MIELIISPRYYRNEFQVPAEEMFCHTERAWTIILGQDGIASLYVGQPRTEPKGRAIDQLDYRLACHV